MGTLSVSTGRKDNGRADALCFESVRDYGMRSPPQLLRRYAHSTGSVGHYSSGQRKDFVGYFFQTSSCNCGTRRARAGSYSCRYICL